MKTPAQKVGSSAGVRAFRVDVADWPEATSIVRTTSPAKAKFAAWRGAQETGYDLPFARFKARRAPEFDGKTLLIAGRNYDIEYATAADSPNDEMTSTRLTKKDAPQNEH